MKERMLRAGAPAANPGVAARMQEKKEGRKAGFGERVLVEGIMKASFYANEARSSAREILEVSALHMINWVLLASEKLGGKKKLGG
jgi:hypothetical protein